MITIHLRAGLVDNLGDWKFSSFKDYSAKRNGTLYNKELTQELLELPKDNDEFIKLSQKTIPDRYIDKIF